MKIIAILVGCAAAVSASAAGTSFDPIDLNRPGTMEQLQVDHPARYIAIAEVLRVAERLPCEGHELDALKALYDVHEMTCYATLMTSLPPKRHVSFQIEGTSYVANVTMKDTGGRVLPAR